METNECEFYCVSKVKREDKICIQFLIPLVLCRPICRPSYPIDIPGGLPHAVQATRGGPTQHLFANPVVN